MAELPFLFTQTLLWPLWMIPSFHPWCPDLPPLLPGAAHTTSYLCCIWPWFQVCANASCALMPWVFIIDSWEVILTSGHFKVLHPSRGVTCPRPQWVSSILDYISHLIIYMVSLLQAYIYVFVAAGPNTPWMMESQCYSNLSSSISYSEILTGTSPLPYFSTPWPSFLINKIKEFNYKVRLDDFQVLQQRKQYNALSMTQLSPHPYKASSGTKLSMLWIKIHVHPSPTSVLILWENNAVYFADPVTVLPHNTLLFFWNGRLSFPVCLTEGPISPNT